MSDESPGQSTGNEPTVTVFVTAYNHGEFIAQALDSVLSQVTSFAVDTVVIDDFSTDNTREILGNYKSRHPEKVRLVLAPRNEYSNDRLAAELRRSSAPYFCILDGDDYWTSTAKLQRQVDFLETHSECSMVFHNALVVDESGAEPPWNITPADQPPITTLDSIWGSGHIASCSVMVRRSICPTFPQWYLDAEVGDWALNILAGINGKIGYINEVMGVYRRHRGGLWTSKNEIAQREVRIRFYRKLKAALDGAYATPIKAVLDHALLDLLEHANVYRQRRDWQALRATTLALLRQYPREYLRLKFAAVVPQQRPPAYWRYPPLADKLMALRDQMQRLKEPAIEGHFDSADCTWLMGWARDRSRPGTRLNISIRSDGNIVGTTRADRFRLDLLDAGIGNGYHAFKCALPDAVADGAPHRITVSVDDSEQPLAGKQFVVQCPRSDS